MRIRISTDSTADIPAALREELGINVVPIELLFADGHSYRDGFDMTPRECFEMVKQAEKMPTTSQITPYRFYDLYKESLEQGYTDLIHLSINSKGSSTFANAETARDDFYRKHPECADTFHIHLIDGRSYTMTYGYAAMEAAKMVQTGKTADEIVAFCEDWVQNCRAIFVPMELTYVRKSGRISPTAAILGDMLGLKPVIMFEDGYAKTIAKLRSEKKVVPGVMDIVNHMRKPNTPYLIICGEHMEFADKLEAACIEQFGGQQPALKYDVGGIICTHTGPNMVGIVIRV